MIKVGDALPGWRIESVSAEKMKALAVILRDPNPIHVDPDAVKKLGLGDRVINQGPANLGYVVNMIQAAWPGARIEKVEARFMGNVFGGDAVEACGRVTSSEVAADGQRIGCEVWLDVEGRGRALFGVVTLLLPKQPSSILR